MTMKYNAADFKENQLPTCFLDTCMFSAGMVSDFLGLSFSVIQYRKFDVNFYPSCVFTQNDMHYVEKLKANLAYRNRTMIAVHANYLIGNRWKMLRLLENGLWIAAPTSAIYPPATNITEDMLRSNRSIADNEGNIYDLEHVVLSETRWGKCVDYIEQ
jgi:hypothetical protein